MHNSTRNSDLLFDNIMGQIREQRAFAKIFTFVLRRQNKRSPEAPYLKLRSHTSWFILVLHWDEAPLALRMI